MDKEDTKEEYLMQIAKGGISWIIPALVFFIFFCIASVFTTGTIQFILIFLSFCLGLLTSLFIIFFRDPTRLIGKDIIASADGIIRKVGSVHDPEIGDAWFISTFMNIYHVHVNRMPMTGTIQKITHHPGSHLPAFKKESDRNERVVILVKTAEGLMKIVLIAGTLARRIVLYVKTKDTVRKGERISLIRLGSRVDVYLAKELNVHIQVSEKDHMKAGESTLATPNV